MVKPYIGEMCGIGMVSGMRLSEAKREYNWGIIGRGYEWVPVINGRNIVVDIISVNGDANDKRSFDKGLPVVWDGYKGAYRVVA